MNYDSPAAVLTVLATARNGIKLEATGGDRIIVDIATSPQFCRITLPKIIEHNATCLGRHPQPQIRTKQR